MFQTIPDKIKKRMLYLEELDSIDRNDGTTQLKRMRQMQLIIIKL